MGVAAAYFFLEKNFGRRTIDWKLNSQSARRHKGKIKDRMEIQLKQGGRKTVFFDISEFFGKL